MSVICYDVLASVYLKN